jgi:hypothetical protein
MEPHSLNGGASVIVTTITTTTHHAELIRGGSEDDVARLLRCGGRLVRRGNTLHLQEIGKIGETGEVDGEFVVEALGLPAPLFRDLRPPETFPAHAARGSTLHRWRMSVASSITGVGNPLNLDDE